MRLIRIPHAQAQELWWCGERFVTNAMTRMGLSDLEAVKRAVLSGDAVLWLAADDDNEVIGAGVTELQIVGEQKVCVIVAWGSDDQERCASLRSVIEQHARDEGCSKVRLFGRTGWPRKLRDYEVCAVVMEKELL